MRLLYLIACVLALVASAPAAFAEARELGSEELRNNVRSGKSLALPELFAIMEQKVEGEILDVRAFETDGIYYRFLIKLSDGKLAEGIMNARTGGLVSRRSSKVREIRDAI